MRIPSMWTLKFNLKITQIISILRDLFLYYHVDQYKLWFRFEENLTPFDSTKYSIMPVLLFVPTEELI